MTNIESKNNGTQESKGSSKLKKIVMAGALISTIFSACTEKTPPLKTYKEGSETIQHYTDFYIIESKTKHEIHIKNGVNIIIYANADPIGEGQSGEVCITTKEHPTEVFSDKSWSQSEKYEIIYK